MVHLLDQTDGYSWDSFKHLVDWLAFALGVETEPPRIGINANEALYRTVNIEPLLLQPCDYFGAALAARKGSGGKAWNPTAFFPTPHHLVELMTQLTMSHEDDLRSKKVSDPWQRSYVASRQQLLATLVWNGYRPTRCKNLQDQWRALCSLDVVSIARLVFW